MVTALTLWYDDVLPDLPGLSSNDAIVTKLIREAAITFCEKSQAHIIDHPPLNIVANQPTYAFAPGTDLVVITPKKVLVNGLSILPATDDDLDALYGDNWRNGVLGANTAAWYRQPDDANIQIVPTPPTDIPGGLVMRVVVKPTAVCTQVDDRLYNQTLYRNAITACVKWRAKAMSKKPYTDLEAAGYWSNEFNRLCGAAALRAARGFGVRPARTTTVDSVGSVARNSTLPQLPWNP
jgi:hypothetical protein